MTLSTSVAALPRIVLKPRADRRLRRGHRWLYSNEIDSSQSDLASLEPGQAALVYDARDKLLGSAFIDRRALLCGRLYSRKAELFDEALIARRLREALAWRERCYPVPCYRMVYGDADGFPGLVVDRYGDYLVLQASAAGVQALVPQIVDALQALVAPRGIVVRSEPDETLTSGKAQDRQQHLVGEVPARVALTENGVDFVAPLLEGQKTGWFYDHRESRGKLAAWAGDAKVLDVFSYVGGWGLQLLAAGANALCAIDSSAAALDCLLDQPVAQARGRQLRTMNAPAIEAMKTLIADGERFDIVVLDPPAFIKRQRDQEKGEQAYHRINQLAVRLLAPQGLLVSASCSMHLSAGKLSSIVATAAHKADRSVATVYRGGLGFDHPILPAIPETDYLKALFARIGPAF